MTRSTIVGVASHKGGTGRTTLTLGLAWALGQAGRRVGLVDAAPTPTHDLIACDAAGRCAWPGVERFESVAEARDSDGLELVLVDLPPLLSRPAAASLRRCDAVLLTCLPDPLALRTLVAATRACEAAVAERPEFAVLGVVVGLFNEATPHHRAVLEELMRFDPDLVVEPPVPVDPALGRWAMAPGSAPAEGPGREVLLRLAEELLSRAEGLDSEAESRAAPPAPAEPAESSLRDRFDQLIDEGAGDVSSFAAFAADDDDLPDSPPSAPSRPAPPRENRTPAMPKRAPLRLDEPVLRSASAESAPRPSTPRPSTPRRSRRELETRDEPRPDFARQGGAGPGDLRHATPTPVSTTASAPEPASRAFEEETVSLRSAEVSEAAASAELEMRCHYCEQEISPSELARGRARVVGEGRLACRGCAVHVRQTTGESAATELETTRAEPEAAFPAPEQAVDAPRRSSTTRVLIRRLLSFLGDGS